MSGHHHHEVSGKNLLITILLNIIITVSQIIGGIFSGSLALLSDAVHNFSDVLSLLIAWGANRLSVRPGNEAHTFGFKRAEIIAALFNASLLMGIALFLIIEAFHKFYHPEPIASGWVIGLGLLSIVLNAASVLLVKEDAHDNMNVKAAYLHLMTDVMTSVAVVAGGLLMYYFGLFWIDPLISMLIAVYLIAASWGIVKESAEVLMQFAPQGIDLGEISKAAGTIRDVENIHHVHLWRLNDHEVFFEAHIDFAKNLTLEETTEKMIAIETMLKEHFPVTHVTLQPEYHRNDEKSLIAGDG